ncbi:MAG: phytochelatin synthase [Desulfobacterales bacterium]|nr:phytochelatin synthase [Desulfobacterales bacterium]
MRLLRILMHACLQIPYGFHKITGTGAFGPRGATILTGPIETRGNALKQALIQHHVKQYHEASCSVASVVSVVNALGAVQGKAHGPIGQLDLLDAVQTARWKKRMSQDGDNGRRGLPLTMLGAVVKSSLDAYQITYKGVEIIQARKGHSASRKIRAMLRRRLVQFDPHGRCLIIAHFDQGAYVPTLNIPHISPVGAFDGKTGDITILDVDPEQQNPYRLSFDHFYQGLASDYHHVFKPFGYGSGGAVCIRL